MTDQSVFSDNETPEESQQEQEQQVTPAQPSASKDNVFADQLASIRNERGEPKYSSVEEALKGAAHAQEYIAQLKSELDSLKSEKQQLSGELEKRESVEEVIARLTAKKDEDQKATPESQSLNEQTITELLERTLTARETKTKQQSNVEQVQSALLGKFGDKTKEMVQAKAKELGTTAEEIGKMAATNPKIVLKLFDVNSSSPQPSVKTTLGSQNVPSEYAPKDDVLEKPSKSLLAGATSQEQTEYFKKIKDHVYKKHGVQV